MESVQDNIGDLSTTNRLPLLTAFVAVTHAHSFTRAAKRTGIDKSLLSRRVKALEDSLGVRLLNRTTRRLSLTDAGRSLFDRVVGALGEVQGALSEAAAPGPIAGKVKIAAIPALAGSVLVPVLAELRRVHPDLEVSIQATETFVNLVEGGFDLAIRAGNLPDSSLIARRLGELRYVLCGSPDWVARHPEVKTPADLVDHWVLFDAVPNATRWRFHRGDTGMEVQVARTLATNNGLVQLEAVRGGLGVAPMGPLVVAESFGRGDLVRVLPDWQVEGNYGIYGVTPHRTHLPARVVVLLAAIQRRIKELQPAWDALSR
jgi:DNA-binding transcriptional LysR family regulator